MRLVMLMKIVLIKNTVHMFDASSSADHREGGAINLDL